MLKAVYVLLISAVIFACSQKAEETQTEEPAAPAVTQEQVADNYTAVDNLTTEAPAMAEDNASAEAGMADNATPAADNASAN
ncbi:hypothetical protein EP073_12395 [Geovibrio thiophilus]|uniref:Lipoprotein n=1 Tax=Geovibrio thiophilus TaxID=139438 RepID=A0A3R5Y8E6_9BACT|nr:hypothetical protein [Geovibrio thiophilus]QAR34176.1 hypothetical protein EP073_12395 [Geovibrio thiophilus]